MPATAAEVEAFVARHWTLAHRVIGARVRSLPDAHHDDARSDGLLALWEAAQTHNPAKGGEVSHVIRTINWRTIDRYRGRHGRPGTPSYRPPPDSLDDLPPALADPADPVDLITELVDGRAVHEVLEALQEQHRDVLTAHYLDEQSFAELGREWGVSESGAFRRVSTALEIARRVRDGLPATTQKRPSHITCGDCGALVPVKATGRMPRYCSSYHAWRARTKHAPHLPAQRSRWGAFVRSASTGCCRPADGDCRRPHRPSAAHRPTRHGAVRSRLGSGRRGGR